eukprot:TRINITY_DN3464_c0_g1_i1.p2 TRINITY_DN3464_c0_g1~~TRINITY_DN3464_c0_g1_i1.p2  ORF type:complete len:341 (-),score=42.66 TRINITY_DN3464_c0_g1_i1:2670-3692(-)
MNRRFNTSLLQTTKASTLTNEFTNTLSGFTEASYSGTAPQPLMIINSDTETSVDPFSQRQVFAHGLEEINENCYDNENTGFTEVLQACEALFISQCVKVGFETNAYSLNKVKEGIYQVIGNLDKQKKYTRKLENDNETKNRVILSLNEKLKTKMFAVKKKYKKAKFECKKRLEEQLNMYSEALELVKQKQSEIDSLEEKVEEMKEKLNRSLQRERHLTQSKENHQELIMGIKRLKKVLGAAGSVAKDPKESENVKALQEENCKMRSVLEEIYTLIFANSNKPGTIVERVTQLIRESNKYHTFKAKLRSILSLTNETNTSIIRKVEQLVNGTYEEVLLLFI